MLSSRYLLSTFFDREMNDDRRQEESSLYHISVSGHNSTDELCAITILDALKFITSTKQISRKLYCPIIALFYVYITQVSFSNMFDRVFHSVPELEWHVSLLYAALAISIESNLF
jgi:hypothetical protein